MARENVIQTLHLSQVVSTLADLLRSYASNLQPALAARKVHAVKQIGKAWV
jgi:hypothetical protein